MTNLKIEDQLTVGAGSRDAWPIGENEKYQPSGIVGLIVFLVLFDVWRIYSTGIFVINMIEKTLNVCLFFIYITTQFLIW